VQFIRSRTPGDHQISGSSVENKKQERRSASTTMHGGHSFSNEHKGNTIFARRPPPRSLVSISKERSGWLKLKVMLRYSQYTLMSY